jgi:hypothetical protein
MNVDILFECQKYSFQLSYKTIFIGQCLKYLNVFSHLYSITQNGPVLSGVLNEKILSSINNNLNVYFNGL